jgi:hypothetical protein
MMDKLSTPMIAKQYLRTAQALLHIAKRIVDEMIADRLMALAVDYERRARKADPAEAAQGLAPADHAELMPRLAKSN